MNPIQPLKQQFKIDEDKGFVKDQILERCRSEDNYTHCKGFPLTSYEDKKDILCPRITK